MIITKKNWVDIGRFFIVFVVFFILSHNWDRMIGVTPEKSVKSIIEEKTDTCRQDKIFYWSVGNELRELKFHQMDILKNKDGVFWVFYDCKGKRILKYIPPKTEYEDSNSFNILRS